MRCFPVDPLSDVRKYLFHMRRFLPVLLLLFVGSGCAALIYEVVWFQLLQLVIGSSAVSLAVLLGTYMGGMCLGSLLLPRYISSRRHPLRVYAWIEAGIGLCGLLVLFGVPRLDDLYVSIAVPGFAGILLRAGICVVCLLPPTLLMGASLPAMARWVEADAEGISWLGFFYGGNIAGAVLGSVLAGFYLLRLFDMAVATYAAAGINVAVALVGFALAAAARFESAVSVRAANTSQSAFSRASTTSSETHPIYFAIALSGLSALGAEVVWTRLLSLMLGATVYTFSIILAVFLAGLGIGSSAGAALAKRSSNPRIALGLCQFLLACTAAWAAFAISTLIPSPGFDPTVATDPIAVFQMDIWRCAWAVFPSALLWGASFPLALAAVARPPRASIVIPQNAEEGAATEVFSGAVAAEAAAAVDSGELVGRVYAANTVGGIVGALLFSMILIPSVGTQQAERMLVVIPAIAAVLMLIGATQVWKLAAGAVVVVLLNLSLKAVPWLAIAYGRRMNQYTQYNSTPLYIGEGMNSSVVVSEYPSGVRYFHVSGKVEATTERFDMRLQRMLGHLSALFVKKPESVLVVGFGAGVTAGSFTQHPDVKRIVISEIEPLIPPASTKYFAAQNYNVFNDPRTEVHYDDARHFVLTSKEKFDIITSDPIHPWVKGTSTLYSKEYFELCKRHLKPGGVVTQWIPLYESDFETIRSEIATFFEVFPHATIWNSDVTNQGYDVVIVGQAEPGPIDLDAFDARIQQPDHARVVASLTDVGLGSTMDLMATYAGRQDELAGWLKDAPINRDINMRLQYLAGWGLNFNRPDLIYQRIVSYRGFPQGLFHGSENRLALLKSLLEGQGH
jgi:spermidine synthase